MGLLDMFPGIKRRREEASLGTEEMRMKNEAMRAQLLGAKRQRDAMGQLSGLLAPSNAPAGNMVEATPDMQRQRMMGLLGQVAPKEVATSLLFPSQERAEPPDVRIARILADPNTSPALARELRSLTEKDTGNTDDLLKRVQLALATNELNATQEDRKMNQRSLTDGFRNGISGARKILDANSKLEGTFLETGRSFPEYRAAMSSVGADLIDFFGGDASKQRLHLTEFNTFKKQAANFAIDMVDRLEGATNQKFGVLRDSIANIGVDPQTNRRIIGEVIKRTMQEADRYDLNIPDNERAEAFDLLKDIERGERYFELSATVPGFRDLSQTEKEKFIRKLNEMPPEQREAILGR